RSADERSVLTVRLKFLAALSVQHELVLRTGLRGELAGVIRETRFERAYGEVRIARLRAFVTVRAVPPQPVAGNRTAGVDVTIVEGVQPVVGGAGDSLRELPAVDVVRLDVFVFVVRERAAMELVAARFADELELHARHGHVGRISGGVDRDFLKRSVVVIE